MKPFFLNIVLLNKDSVVAKTVAEKTGLRSGGFLGRAAAFAANKVVTDEKVLNTLAEVLIEKITKEVDNMGISANVSKSFQIGALVVIRVEIVEVDKITLILAAKGPEFASSFSLLLTAINAIGVADTALPGIDERILNQVYDAMMVKFAEIIPKKMEESGLLVDCTVKSSQDEAEHFFEIAERLNSA